MLKARFRLTQSAATAYYRFYQMMPYFKDASLKILAKPIDWNHIPQSSFFENSLLMGHHELDKIFKEEFNEIVTDSDIFITQRIHGNGGKAFLKVIRDPLPDNIDETFKKRSPRVAMITDIDDAVFDLPIYSHAYANYEPGSPNFHGFNWQINNSDGITVSTEYLKKYMLKHFPSADIGVIKNTIRTFDWKPKDKDKEVWNIVWSASADHEKNTDMLMNHMRLLKSRYGERVNITFTGGVPQKYKGNAKVTHNENGVIFFENEMDGIKYICRGTSLPKYREHLCELKPDIFLAPLVDNIFNRCKSNLRFLEGAALKAKVVASYVEPFKKDIDNKKCTRADMEGNNNWFNVISSIIDAGKIANEVDAEVTFDYIKKEYNPKYEAKEYEAFLNKIYRKVKNELDNRGDSQPCKND